MTVEKTRGDCSKDMEPAMAVNILKDNKEIGYGVRKSLLMMTPLQLPEFIGRLIVPLRNIVTKTIL